MRRAPAEVRTIEPDPVYKSVLVSQVINKVLWRGKKGAARRIVYGAMDIVEKRTGGSSYQVPVEVRPRRAQTLAVRWLVEFARKRKEPTMAMRLANEILDAANRTGAAVKRREDIHKMAESNKAFAHYRW